MKVYKPNPVTGKQTVIDSPGIQTDELQFIPATVTAIINSGESPLLTATLNEAKSNEIQVKKNVWDSSGLALRTSSQKYYKPLLRGISESIVIGDAVLIIDIGQQGYYLGPINTRNSPSINMDMNLSDDASSNSKGDDGTSATFPKDVFFSRLTKQFNVDLDDPAKTLTRVTHPKTGNEVFSDIHTDLTLEGRHGNSIRIGSRSTKPYIFISNGRSIGQTRESINDTTLIGIIEAGTISQHFKNESLDDEAYEFKMADESIETPTQTIRNTFLQSLGRGNGIDGEDDEDIDDTIYGFDNPQTILNSERIILNARKDNLYLSAFSHLHMGSGNTMTFSTSRNTLFNVNDNFVVNSPEIKLGSQVDDDTEPIALGDTLVEKLEELCDHLTQLCTDIQSMTHPTPAGPSGPPVNAASFASLSSTIGQTKGALVEILSERNRTA